MNPSKWLLTICVAAAASCLFGCGDSQAPVLLAPAYTLTSINRNPVPFVTDSTRLPGFNRDVRIVGRSLQFLSADTAVYAEATDVVEPLPDGSLKTWATDCFRLLVGYLERRSFVVLTIDLNVFRGLGDPPVPIRYDTLTVVRDTLVGRQRLDATRVLRLSFTPGQPPAPICQAP